MFQGNSNTAAEYNLELGTCDVGTLGCVCRQSGIWNLERAKQKEYKKRAANDQCFVRDPKCSGKWGIYIEFEKC
jgi:hypothetical protein